MSKTAFDAIKVGLTDAVAYAKGDKSRGRAHRVQIPEVDVSAVRAKLGMTQAGRPSARSAQRHSPRAASRSASSRLRLTAFTEALL